MFQWDICMLAALTPSWNRRQKKVALSANEDNNKKTLISNAKLSIMRRKRKERLELWEYDTMITVQITDY